MGLAFLSTSEKCIIAGHVLSEQLAKQLLINYFIAFAAFGISNREWAFHSSH
jgi:hypothetical protein